MTSKPVERWFKCYPSRLLGALAGMNASQQLVYVIVLLRIYENSGTCPDTPATLVRRTSLTNRMISEALDALIASNRLYRDKSGFLRNRVADRFIEKIREFRVLNDDKESARPNQGREKPKRIQRNAARSRMGKLPESHPTRDSLSFSLEGFSESKGIKELELLPLEDSQSNRVSESEIPSLAKWKFDEFWRQYPHKVGKRAAVKAFDAARKRGGSFVDLMGGLLRYAAKDDDRPWCNPATFLNQERWLDEPAANGGKRHDETVTERGARLVEQALKLEAERRAQREGRAF